MKTIKLRSPETKKVYQYTADSTVQGVLVNPVLPKNFENTPNDARSELENNRWWGFPYVQSYRFSMPDINYRAFVERMESYNFKSELPDRREYVQDKIKSRAEWYKSFPGGVRYDVHCLDGGAWDRPTWWGSFSKLDEAIDCCKNGADHR